MPIPDISTATTTETCPSCRHEGKHLVTFDRERGEERRYCYFCKTRRIVGTLEVTDRGRRA